MLKVPKINTYNLRRRLTTKSPYLLTCGLEVHTQLNTKSKLFSYSTNNPFEALSKPNFHTSFFDIAVPGSQPNLNYEAVLFASRLALSLNSKIDLNSQFDRKHYFYGDQPQGYQITQHYHPFSKGGHLTLFKDFDEIDEDSKNINITQLQIEQDTARSTYLHESKTQDEMLLDFNRSNVPLIELVTEPDFHNVKQVKAFIKKYQNLVRQLKISTGYLETGSIRVDVNVSVDEHPRVELKNLPNTSSIINAINFEYERQVDVLKEGDKKNISHLVETRGWDGTKTFLLRSKESTVDYRYMADPELPPVALHETLLANIKEELPNSVDYYTKQLIEKPYCLTMKDAKILTIQNELNDLYNNEELKDYFLQVFNVYVKELGDGVSSKIVVNWLLHELLGNLKKLDIPLQKLSKALLTPEVFAEFLLIIHNGEMSNASGKLLLYHILEIFKESNYTQDQKINFQQLIKKFDLASIKEIDYTDLEIQCQNILVELNNPKMIEGIKSGKKKNSMKFLIGLGMRKYQGKIKPEDLEMMFKKIMKIEW